jgi:hypothetical protein
MDTKTVTKVDGAAKVVVKNAKIAAVTPMTPGTKTAGKRTECK